MAPHGHAFALGYDYGKSIDAGIVLIQLLLELGLEVIVDGVVMWSEMEHEIPVTAYFALIKSPYVVLFHVMVMLLATGVNLFGFLRHVLIRGFTLFSTFSK